MTYWIGDYLQGNLKMYVLKIAGPHTREGAWITGVSTEGESFPSRSIGSEQGQTGSTKILEILRHRQFQLISPKFLENQVS